jgi:hypothetical protein
MANFFNSEIKGKIADNKVEAVFPDDREDLRAGRLVRLAVLFLDGGGGFGRHINDVLFRRKW